MQEEQKDGGNMRIRMRVSSCKKNSGHNAEQGKCFPQDFPVSSPLFVGRTMHAFRCKETRFHFVARTSPTTTMPVTFGKRAEEFKYE